MALRESIFINFQGMYSLYIGEMMLLAMHEPFEPSLTAPCRIPRTRPWTVVQEKKFLRCCR